MQFASTQLNGSLPSDTDAERGCLGTILLDSRLLDQAVGLTPGDFYNPNHRAVFSAMLELRSKQTPIDSFTISDILRRDNLLDSVGGTTAVTNLSFGLPYAESIEHWVKSVQEKAALRSLMRVGDEIRALASNGTVPATELIALSSEKLRTLTIKPANVKAKSLGSLWKDHPALRPAVIEGLIRKGEIMNIIAKSKVGKSWFVYNVMFSVALGFLLFGQFRCKPGKVLLVDNELHPETLSYRLEEVRKAWGIRIEDVVDSIEIITLRGNLTDINQLRSIFAKYKPGTFQLVIIDALYRIQPTGQDENGNSAMTATYNLLDQYAAMLDAPIAVVHHASKGDQGGKDVTDVGSGASAQARATDTHLVLRPHQDENCVVLDAAVRSFAPVEPIALKFEFPIWRRAEGVDVTALKGKKPGYEVAKEAKDAEGMRLIFDALTLRPDTVRGLKTRVPMGYTRIERLIAALRSEGKVVGEWVKNRGQECERFTVV